MKVGDTKMEGMHSSLGTMLHGTEMPQAAASPYVPLQKWIRGEPIYAHCGLPMWLTTNHVPLSLNSVDYLVICIVFF